MKHPTTPRTRRLVRCLALFLFFSATAPADELFIGSATVEAQRD